MNIIASLLSLQEVNDTNHQPKREANLHRMQCCWTFLKHVNFADEEITITNVSKLSPKQLRVTQQSQNVTFVFFDSRIDPIFFLTVCWLLM